MCVPVSSFLFLFLLTTVTIMCGTRMGTEGLPLRKQEHGSNYDLLEGADFLSVLLESSLRRAYRETTTPPPTSTILFEAQEELTDLAPTTYVRTSRETSPFVGTSTEQEQITMRSDLDITNVPSDSVIVAVSVSSSVGKFVKNRDLSDTTLSDTITEPPTTEYPDRKLVVSEDKPSLLAKASKSELNVEESDPITNERDLMYSDFTRNYPANVQALPRQSFVPNSDFSDRSHKEKQPFHQTLIFHDNTRDPARARSVSYSTVIQAISEDEVETEKPQQYERHQRNYDGAQISHVNNFNEKERPKSNESSFFPNLKSENKNFYASNAPKNWEKPEVVYIEPRQPAATTETNWETQEKPYVPPTQTSAPLPKMYGQPEQNYEVDEAVSVVTNGRAHGVQPLESHKIDTSGKKKDDNQKFGYVVEGRNYRKYRVEERTADGFIVGEYGVVSHDDGSLRGVRYTADGTINPRLISDALMKFLSL